MGRSIEGRHEKATSTGYRGKGKGNPNVNTSGSTPKIEGVTHSGYGPKKDKSGKGSSNGGRPGPIEGKGSHTGYKSGKKVSAQPARANDGVGKPLRRL